jgi:hypothetical protein
MKKVPKKKYQFSLMSGPDSFPLMEEENWNILIPIGIRTDVKIESRIRISKIQDWHSKTANVANPQHCLHKILVLLGTGTLSRPIKESVLRIWIRDPAPFWPRIRDTNRFFPDPGFQSIFLRAYWQFFWAYNSIILCKLAQIFFLHHFKTKIIFNFVVFTATKTGRTTNFFFHPSLLLLFMDLVPVSHLFSRH